MLAEGGSLRHVAPLTSRPPPTAQVRRLLAPLKHPTPSNSRHSASAFFTESVPPHQVCRWEITVFTCSFPRCIGSTGGSEDPPSPKHTPPPPPTHTCRRHGVGPEVTPDWRGDRVRPGPGLRCQPVGHRSGAGCWGVQHEVLHLSTLQQWWPVESLKLVENV